MKSNRTAWGLLAPTIAILGFFGLIPFIFVVYVGFHDWNVFSKTRGLIWVAEENYRRLVFDKDFLIALWRGILFTIYAVGIEMVLGIVLAQLLMRKFKGRAFFRAVYSLPLAVAPIVVGSSWRLMTFPGVGPLSYWLNKIGINYNIGQSVSQAILTVVLMDVWHWTPFVTLIMVAGLSALPMQVLEAAMVDGANKWQRFRYIILPMLKPVILTALFLRIMDALRIVDEVWMLTGGGPGTATRYAGIHIWRVVFPKSDYGYGSAMSVLVLYFILVVCFLLYTVITQIRRGGGYER